MLMHGRKYLETMMKVKKISSFNQKNSDNTPQFIGKVNNLADKSQMIELGFCPYCGNDLYHVSEIIGFGRYVVCSQCEKIWEAKVQYEELPDQEN